MSSAFFLLVRCWWKHDGNVDVYSDDIEWSESLPVDANVKPSGTKELNKWKVGRQVRAAGWRSLTEDGERDFFLCSGGWRKCGR
jgi:hypothetical protein